MVWGACNLGVSDNEVFRTVFDWTSLARRAVLPLSLDAFQTSSSLARPDLGIPRAGPCQ